MSPPYGRSFFTQHKENSSRSAHAVLSVLLQSTYVKEPTASLLDVGCGIGTWVAAARERGVRHAVGIDGHYIEVPELLCEAADFIPCDLDDPKELSALKGVLGRFDLVISMEVAEHLSPCRASGYISDICSFGDLILFSAAVPGQGGINRLLAVPSG